MLSVGGHLSSKVLYPKERHEECVCEGAAGSLNDDTTRKSKPTALVKKYVIIGNGVAAKSAKHTLHKLLGSKFDRNSLVIDGGHIKHVNHNNSGTEYLCEQVVSIDTAKKTLSLDSGKTVQYDQCLLATGACPVSIDPRFVDTELLPNDVRNSYVFTDFSAERMHDMVRIVSHGGHVTVIGGGTFNAVAVASYLASEGRRHGYRSCVTLMMPNFGVMSTVLPRYLSIAMTQRLKKAGIELMQHNQLQYITTQNYKPYTQPAAKTAKDTLPVMIYSADTLDHLRNCNFETHRILFANTIPPGIQHVSTSDSSTMSHFAEGFDALETDFNGGFLVNRFLQVRVEHGI